MARLALASRPALKSPAGSGTEAPLKTLTFTWSLKTPIAHTLPRFANTGVPHFPSSAIAGSASWISSRSRWTVERGQPSRPAMYVSICADASVMEASRRSRCSAPRRGPGLVEELDVELLDIVGGLEAED